MAKARSMNPDWTTFNGYANQYVTHPLTAKPGETTRFYVVAAGPTLDSNFHVVGTIFDRAWVNGDMTSPPQVGVQTVDRPGRRRRRLRRQDRRRGPVPVRQPRLRARRPRPGRPAQGRQPEGDDVPLMDEASERPVALRRRTRRRRDPHRRPRRGQPDRGETDARTTAAAAGRSSRSSPGSSSRAEPWARPRRR